MATTITSAFKELTKNLNITDRQTTAVANCKNNVVSKIGAELTLYNEKSRVIGSWHRDTMTRYLSECDIDVLIVLHYAQNKVWHSSDGTVSALSRFKRILDTAYPQTPCRVDQHCVTMKLSQFRLDVVPAFRYDDGTYLIPDTHSRIWIRTNPITFANEITRINRNMNGAFVPLIKIIKGWNRNCGWPIKSFHLECMLYKHFHTYARDYTYSSMVYVFFESLPNYLAVATYDPATGNRVDAYLDSGGMVTKRAAAIRTAQQAASSSKQAYGNEGHPQLAIPQWKTLLGEFFPSWG